MVGNFAFLFNCTLAGRTSDSMTVPFTVRSKAVLLLWCFVFVLLLRLFIAALWSPDGTGLSSLLSFVMFYYVFATFPCGILDQVWYLIVSIPDLCHPVLLCSPIIITVIRIIKVWSVKGINHLVSNFQMN